VTVDKFQSELSISGTKEGI